MSKKRYCVESERTDLCDEMMRRIHTIISYVGYLTKYHRLQTRMFSFCGVLHDYVFGILSTSGDLKALGLFKDFFIVVYLGLRFTALSQPVLILKL